MSAQHGAAVAFESPADASSIVLSTARPERLDLSAGGSHLQSKFSGVPPTPKPLFYSVHHSTIRQDVSVKEQAAAATP